MVIISVITKIKYYSNLNNANKIQNKNEHSNFCEKHIKTLEELFQAMNSVNISYKDLQNTVYYDGKISPIMIVGEAPGEEEVIQKKPFVGRSGQLLQQMLDAAGLKRENLYITNAILWRPPLNRTPFPEEVSLMRPYLLKHVEIIKPKILILVGGIATKCFENRNIPISCLRGQWRSSSVCKNVISIYHPSFLGRSKILKKITWQDILEIREKIIEEGLESLLSADCLILKKNISSH